MAKTTQPVPFFMPRSFGVSKRQFDRYLPWCVIVVALGGGGIALIAQWAAIHFGPHELVVKAIIRTHWAYLMVGIALTILSIAAFVALRAHEQTAKHLTWLATLFVLFAALALFG